MYVNMYTVTLIAQKGGTSKTTLAINLAVAAEAVGLRCVSSVFGRLDGSLIQYTRAPWRLDGPTRDSSHVRHNRHRLN